MRRNDARPAASIVDEVLAAVRRGDVVQARQLLDRAALFLPAADLLKLEVEMTNGRVLAW